MRRRVSYLRSSGSTTRVKMNVSFTLLVLFVGSAVSYNVAREAPYNVGRNDPYYYQEPSQRLFWSEQGSNQVGGTGLWATLTNKFPFLNNMFGRMELQTQYGVPNQYEVSNQYGPPGYVQQQYQPQVPQFYQQVPQQFPQQVPQQFPQQFGQRFVPSARDVALTDDAVIVTPPFVPISSQPQPAPAPIPAPIPVAPAPAPQPQPGYHYDKPQYRLDLPHK